MKKYPWWWYDTESLAYMLEVVQYFDVKKHWLLKDVEPGSEMCYANEQMAAIHEGLA